MPISSKFYDTLPGEGIKETEWAQSAISRGSLFGVVGKDDFNITPHPTTPYAVNIGPGKAWGHGVWDDHTGSTTVTTTAPPQGTSRWDMISLRRDWQPSGGGPSALRAVQGNSSQALPAGRENRPGIIADQGLWLVQWQNGQTQPRAIIDLRIWAGAGGVEIAHILARGFLEQPGAAVKLDKTTYRYERGANNLWDWGTGDTDWVDCALGGTPGVPGVRFAGNWTRVKSAPCQARLVGGGKLVQLRGELSYVNTGTPSYMPAEGWPIARVPAGMYPSADAFIMGTSDRYRKAQLYVLKPDGNIIIGPGFTGLVAQYNGVAPL